MLRMANAQLTATPPPRVGWGNSPDDQQLSSSRFDTTVKGTTRPIYSPVSSVSTPTVMTHVDYSVETELSINESFTVSITKSIMGQKVLVLLFKVSDKTHQIVLSLDQFIDVSRVIIQCSQHYPMWKIKKTVHTKPLKMVLSTKLFDKISDDSKLGVEWKLIKEDETPAYSTEIEFSRFIQLNNMIVSLAQCPYL